MPTKLTAWAENLFSSLHFYIPHGIRPAAAVPSYEGPPLMVKFLNVTPPVALLLVLHGGLIKDTALFRSMDWLMIQKHGLMDDSEPWIDG